MQQITLSDHLYILFTALFCGSFFSLVAARNHFFFLSSQPEHLSISKSDVFKVFVLFFMIELFFIPLIAGGWLLWNKLDYSQLNGAARGSLNLMVLLCSSGVIFLYTALQPESILSAVFWKGGTKKTVAEVGKDLILGMMTWVLSYPVVTLIGQLFAIVYFFMGVEQPLDQVAVRNMKSVLPYPLLLSGTILAVVLLVPLAEEILFRGFFQNWIVQRFGRVKGIVFTSLLFACFHFSLSQGWTNIELLLSLFVLSCYLGFIYERQRSLWACTALHATFNAISVILILLQV